MILQVSEISLTTPFRPLIEGRLLRCPRCKKQDDVLAYKRLGMVEEFARETTPVYKCPSCRWIFAPADDLVAYLLGRSYDKEF